MITVQELMTPVGTQVDAGQSLIEVLAMMRRNQHSCAVVKDGDRVVGLIREKDLVAVLARVLESGSVAVGQAADVMTVNPVCVPAAASLLEALKRAQEHRQRQMPVLDEQGMLVGMITHTDMAQAYIHILERQSELVSVNRVLKAESLRDSLLNIGNRRAMEQDLEVLAAHPERRYALALLDLDWFKKYNDYYGHQAGDRALQRVSEAITRHLRQGDTLYRYGGEELLLLMLDTDLEGAWQGANRVREAVQQLGIEHAPSPLGVLTLSAGVASEAGVGVSHLIASADQALYYAKTHGHNSVVRAQVSERGKPPSS
ncbi:diguanylate cyclase [Marinimicrobium sp. C6131]|uniref:diguanylate cyclase n=1 Tax=Marinimicrobium sp. C6131 TaxID=3022676 RepID=UPI00223DA359|nr:diguanylate cyclase [Marinimicrobium sp. C6131]UZJ44884.1 diguanylate cyclase [Marinimicrobium sp. C6131]